MHKTTLLFLGVYLATYALTLCPHFQGTPVLLYGLATLGALAIVMLLQNFQYISHSFTPRADYKKCAIFIAGSDQCAGWELATRCVAREMRVYVGVADPDGPQAEWLRRYEWRRSVVIVKLDPGSEEDAAAAARTVHDTLEDREFVGIIYAEHSVPKTTDTLDLNDVRKRIEIDAMGAVNIAQAFTPLLQKHNGRYIIIADMAGRITLPSLLSYCMSQAVTLQFAEIIRNNLKKYGVTVHVVEQLLQNYKKTRGTVFYPETFPDDGKVNVESKADKVDHQLFLVAQSVFRACMSKCPKERYLPSYVDYFIDKIIRYTPPCVSNRVINYYFAGLQSKNTDSS